MDKETKENLVSKMRNITQELEKLIIEYYSNVEFKDIKLYNDELYKEIWGHIEDLQNDFDNLSLRNKYGYFSCGEYCDSSNND